MKKFFKLLILIFAFWQAIFNPVNLSLVHGQEIETPAPTDTPVPTPTPNQSLTTGDATSEAQSESYSNISSITLTPTPTPASDPTPEPSPEESTSPTPTPSEINISNSGNSETTTTANSETGDNSQTIEDESASMETGDAQSISNSINVTNVSSINSNIVTVVQTVLTSDTEDIDLYQMLQNAIAVNPNFTPTDTNITANQDAEVVSDTTANSDTGNNSQSSDTASMTTGNAVALSNAITAVNLNLVSSNVVLAIINILSDWDGNITLPDGSQLSLTSVGGGNVNVTSNHTATVESTTTSNANTGENTQDGENVDMLTGNADSQSNSQSFVNIIQIGGGQGFLIINNSGTWNGNLINWQSPGSIQTFGPGNHNLFNSYSSNDSEGSENLNITSNQNANVTTNVLANANTGKNQQTAPNSLLTTGNAFSLANNFTLANLTSVGGGFFIGIINIFGHWNGDVIAGPKPQEEDPDDEVTPSITSNPPADSRAPDLNISIWNNAGEFVYSGDTLLATITVTNQSPFTAHNVEVKGKLTNDHPMPAIPMNWTIGDLKPNAKAKISFSITLTNDLPEGQYEITAEATGEGDSGNKSSVSSSSSFWVKAKHVLSNFSVPQVFANPELPPSPEVLGAEDPHQEVDINKYLFYIPGVLALLYLLIRFGRNALQGQPILPFFIKKRKNKKNEQT